MLHKSKNGLPILGVVGGLLLSAFTVFQPKAEGVWFTLNSGSPDPGENTSYSLAGQDPGCPDAPNAVCAVQLHPDPNNGNIPDQSELMSLESQTNGFTQSDERVEYKP